ncbi:ComEA family DNA-binding protein [Pseudomonas sp. LARHCG127]|uniref:ComEA family DNA-binding protein n=1 Tax=unclassified Pseudomonas TaxID=196821 RepID=UPI0039850FDE
MRTGYLYSLIFALLTSASVAAIAAPAAKHESVVTPHTVEQPAKTQGAKVDLNRADAATLQRELSGIGKGKAEAIVAYRESNGPFSSVEELLEVKGIGKAILDRNLDKLELN